MKGRSKQDIGIEILLFMIFMQTLALAGVLAGFGLWYMFGVKGSEWPYVVGTSLLLLAGGCVYWLIEGFK